MINDESSILHDLVYSLDDSERDFLIKSAEKVEKLANTDNSFVNQKYKLENTDEIHKFPKDKNFT